MYCRYCGTMIGEGAHFCKCCGQPIVWQAQAAGAGVGAGTAAGAAAGAANGNVYFNNQPQSQIRKNYEGLQWRDFTKLMLLCVLTFGIYNLYMIYQLTSQANALEDEEPKSPAVQTLLCALVPLYFCYWCYMNAKKLSTMLERTTGEKGDYTIVSLILSIASLGVGAILIMQLMINKMLRDPKATSDNAVKSVIIAIVVQVGLAIVIALIGGAIASSAVGGYELSNPYSTMIFLQ